MHARHGTRARALASCAFALFFAGLAACSFSATLCADLEKLPTTPLTSETASLFIDAPDALQVIHGSGCAKLDKGNFLKVEQSIGFAPYVNRATVFLNGWQLKYTDGDHHVKFLGTSIGKISLERNKLTWNAVGRLADNDDDEPFEWCYLFTALGWNAAQIAATVDHDDALDFCNSESGSKDNFYVARNGFDTALSAFRSFVQNDAFIGTRNIAVLPRGFGMGWSGDHHLLQVAYNLDHAEPFVEHKRPYYKADKRVALDLPNGAHRVDDGYVSYQTYAILKDDDARRDYGFGEIVSAIGGADVHVVQPPFAILPFSPVDALVGDAKDEDNVLENVPFEFAIPVLTGWDMGYGNDQHVKEIGVWIDNLQWQKTPGAATGTLRYKLFSRMRDNDGEPGHFIRYKVGILGLKAATGRGGPILRQDLPAQPVPAPTPPAQ